MFVEQDDAVERICHILGFAIFAVDGEQLAHDFDFVVLDVILVAERVKFFELINGLISFAIADKILDFKILKLDLGVDVLSLGWVIFDWVVVLVFLFVLVV